LLLNRLLELRYHIRKRIVRNVSPQAEFRGRWLDPWDDHAVHSHGNVVSELGAKINVSLVLSIVDIAHSELPPVWSRHAIWDLYLQAKSLLFVDISSFEGECAFRNRLERVRITRAVEFEIASIEVGDV